MKKVAQFLMSAICMIYCTFSQSQTQDLYELANGEIFHASYLFEGQNDIWGYIFITDEGETDDELHKFEYVVLDKNLNKIASNSFLQCMSKRYQPRFSSIKKHGDSLVIVGYMGYYATDQSWRPEKNTIRIINLNTTDVSDMFLVRKSSLVKNELSLRDVRDEIRNYSDLFHIYSFDYKSNVAYLKLTKSGKMGFSGVGVITLLDQEYQKIWSTSMRTFSSKGTYLVNDLIVEDQQLIVSLTLIEGANSYSSKTTNQIVSLDLETGETIFKYDIEKPKGNVMHNFSLEVTADKIHIMGSYADYEPEQRYDLSVQKGLFKFTLDMKGNEILKSYRPWLDASKYIPINKKGKIDKKFVVNILSTMSLADGTSVFIAEKTIPKKIAIAKSMLFGFAAYKKKKATDLLCFMYDSTFNLTAVETIEKQKTKGNYSDFLFGQYSKGKTISHFFFQDYKEAETKNEKDQWVLGINSIKDGVLSTEEIPMTSDDHAIVPLRAKEGYILFREFNEKEKFNQLRLERLNF